MRSLSQCIHLPKVRAYHHMVTETMCWGRKNAGGCETPRTMTGDGGPRLAVNNCIVKVGRRFLTHPTTLLWKS